MTTNCDIIEWELDEGDLDGDLNHDDLAAFRSSPLALSRGSIYDQIIESAILDDQEHYDEDDYIYSLGMCHSLLGSSTPCHPLPLFEDNSLYDEPQFGAFDDAFRILDLLPIPNH